jgi:hypothetical protein
MELLENQRAKVLEPHSAGKSRFLGPAPLPKLHAPRSDLDALKARPYIGCGETKRQDVARTPCRFAVGILLFLLFRLIGILGILVWGLGMGRYGRDRGCADCR